MKTPFRLQASEYDCVPTTFVNALSYLFERNEIPPLAIQKIYHYSLDTVTTRKNISHGTTGFAIQLMANWLSEFKTENFAGDSEYGSGSKVNLGRGNKIAKCINQGGVALGRLHQGSGVWHYVLALSVEKGIVKLFDPYRRKKKTVIKNKAEFIEAKGLHFPNLLIADGSSRHVFKQAQICSGHVSRARMSSHKSTCCIAMALSRTRYVGAPRRFHSPLMPDVMRLKAQEEVHGAKDQGFDRRVGEGWVHRPRRQGKPSKFCSPEGTEAHNDIG